MVQKATHSSKAQGRPPNFDQDAVVDAAIAAFWEGGLDGTTLPQLEVATGVDRSTLYNSFGGKTGLYELATIKYLEQAETSLFAPLLDGSNDGYTDIIEFLERLKSGLTSDGARPGCLIVNDMAAGPDKGPGERYQRLLESGLRTALHRSGDTQPATTEHRVSLIASAVIGVNLMSRAGRSAGDVGHIIDSVITQVRDWHPVSAG